MTLKTPPRTRFTTEEVETSKIKHDRDFVVLSMYFEDNKPGYPSHAIGFIRTQSGNVILAKWNAFGECCVNNIRITSFDLIKQSVAPEIIVRHATIALVAVCILCMFI